MNPLLGPDLLRLPQTIGIVSPQSKRHLMSEPASTVYVVDDDPSVRRAIKRLVESVGLDGELFKSPQETLNSSHREVTSCLVLDIRFPGFSGLDFQRQLAQATIPVPFILMPAPADISLP